MTVQKPSPKLSERMLELKQNSIKGLIPYITAGDPNLEFTKKLVKNFSEVGVAAIELGIPFSDPVADGSTNQRAAERALEHGTTLSQIINLVAELRKEGVTTPLILFSYLNPILQMGLENFSKKAQAAGVSAVLCVDLPPEEAENYQKILNDHELEMIFLASPTTSKRRLKTINEFSTGFVYYVSRTGVTGAQSQVSESLDAELTEIRESISRPLAVGFGISNAEQAQQVARHSDAVIVGSAIVKKIENSLKNGENDLNSAESEIMQLVQSILDGLKEI